MKALILAAGFGTRLGRLGEKTPKGLFSNGTYTILDLVIRDLQQTKEIDEIAIVTNNRFFKLYLSYIKQNYENKFIVLNNGVDIPENRKGALGDILFAQAELRWQNEDMMVLVSDTYFQFHFQALIDIYKKYNSFVTVVRKFDDITQIENRLGCAVLKGERIVDFVEKPPHAPSAYAAIPFYIYPKSISHKLLAYKDSGNNMDAPGSFIPYLLKTNDLVHALITDKTTLDIGVPEDLVTLKGLSV